MIFVFPGVEEVCANLLLLHNMLMSELFPTLLRPIKAYSGITGLGHSVILADDLANMAFFICKVISIKAILFPVSRN